MGRGTAPESQVFGALRADDLLLLARLRRDGHRVPHLDLSARIPWFMFPGPDSAELVQTARSFLVQTASVLPAPHARMPEHGLSERGAAQRAARSALTLVLGRYACARAATLWIGGYYFSEIVELEFNGFNRTVIPLNYS